MADEQQLLRAIAARGSPAWLRARRGGGRCGPRPPAVSWRCSRRLHRGAGRSRCCSPTSAGSRRCRSSWMPSWSSGMMNDIWARLDVAVIRARRADRQAHRRRGDGGVGRRRRPARTIRSRRCAPDSRCRRSWRRSARGRRRRSRCASGSARVRRISAQWERPPSPRRWATRSTWRAGSSTSRPSVGCSSRTTRIGTVRGLFDVQPLGESKCAASATRSASTWCERAKPRAFRIATRGVEGVETRTIGRDEELRRAAGRVHRCRRRRRSRGSSPSSPTPAWASRACSTSS